MTGFTEQQTASLQAPLSRQHVKERRQAGRMLSYIEGWHAIAEANRIFGFDGWDRASIDMQRVAEAETKIGPATDRNGNPIPQKHGWRVAYIARERITVRADDRVIVREGCGYGSGIDADLGQAHESAIKEAATDALKRALMTFGNQFGLALYDKEQANVEDEAPAPRPREHAVAAKTQPIVRETPAQAKAMQEARDAWKRIHDALEKAKEPKIIDEIVQINEVHLKAIKAANAEAYEGLMQLAAARKTEMLAAA